MTKKLTSVRLAAALTMCLNLAHALTLQPAGSARAPGPETPAHVANEAAQVAGTGQKRTPRPITAGMRLPTQSADRDMQPAASTLQRSPLPRRGTGVSRWRTW